ncbi:MAG: YbaN family protein [Alphaproteobacteria bacterium]
MNRRALWQVLGLAATGCGFVGAFLPLIPTTPFLLLATFAFARSSPRLHQWLVTHPAFGPLLQNWQRHGAIDRRSKVLAILVMGTTLAASWLVDAPTLVVATQAAVLGVLATFILTRPNGPRSQDCNSETG